MAYVAWSVSFGEQPSAAKWNILGTNDAYFDGLVGSGTAWTAWTPTWTNLTTTSGTNGSKYQKIGKTVIAKIVFTLGASSSVSSNPYFTLPVTSTTDATQIGYGAGSAYDSSTSATYHLQVEYRGNTTAYLKAGASSGAGILLSGVTSTIPFTWATSDQIAITFAYEAA